MSNGRAEATSGERTNGITIGELRQALAALDWSRGLTRVQIKRKYRALPEAIYLRLPASRRYHSAADVLRDAAIAASRAEGDFMGADPDLPEAESREEGGPPAWGPDPIFTPSGSVDSASAEDRSPGDLGD